MTDLTEQWQKGELPNGYYYCKLIINNMKPSIERCKAHRIPMGVSADKSEEVLAPVPSYDEYLSLTYAKEEDERIIAEYEAENIKLKELLKECREFFYENLIDTEFHFSCGLGSNIKKQSCIRSLSNLKTKINQALGEDK